MTGNKYNLKKKEAEQDKGTRVLVWDNERQVVIFNMEVRVGIVERVTLEQRLEGFQKV